MKKRVLLIVALMSCGVMLRGEDEMRLDSLYSPLSLEEVEAFVSYLDAHAATSKRNFGNNMIYGPAGGQLEALCFLYRQTHYLPALPLMCRLADAMLADRNDQPNGMRVAYSMGGVQPSWANSGPPAFNGVEIGGIAGHILFVAENILRTPSVWRQKVPDGDLHHYGRTYRDRALTYVRLCDQTLRDYLMKYFIRTRSDYRAFEDGPKTKAPPALSNCVNRFHPWNRQFMMIGGFVHGAACHKILKDDRRLAAEYDKVVQALIDFFVSQVRVQKKDGHVCSLWNYWPEAVVTNSAGQVFRQRGGKIEDANDAHMAYDLYGLHLCRLYGYANISDELMARFCNTVKYVVYDPSNAPRVFRGNVAGGSGKRDKNFLWPQCILLGAHDRELYRLIFEAPGSAMKRGIKRDANKLGRVLYVKSILYGLDPRLRLSARSGKR